MEGHGGVVFETVGDAVYAAFARPTDAVAAALAGQRGPAAGGLGRAGELRARMGLHLGEVERQGARYFGAPLYRCARLTATANGGQAVLSEATRLVRDALPAGAGLRDLGEHRLKDLPRPERVFQLTAPGTSAEFPPLATLDALPHNLPVQPTGFVGASPAAAVAEKSAPRIAPETAEGPPTAGAFLSGIPGRIRTPDLLPRETPGSLRRAVPWRALRGGAAELSVRRRAGRRRRGGAALTGPRSCVMMAPDTCSVRRSGLGAAAGRAAPRPA